MLIPDVPLLGRMSRLASVRASIAGTKVYVIRRDEAQSVAWVSRSPRVAAFMRTWFEGFDAGALPSLWDCCGFWGSVTVRDKTSPSYREQALWRAQFEGSFDVVRPRGV